MATNKNGQNGKLRPAFVKKYWPVEVVVFEHTNGDGKSNYSVKLTKSFRRDEESEWETSDYLSAENLLSARELLADAYRYIQSRRQKAFESRQETEQAEEAVHF